MADVGYGAYGITVSPAFSTERLSALDARVRLRDRPQDAGGGAMMGYQWYLDGKRGEAHQHVQRLRRRVRSPPRGVERYVEAGNISIEGTASAPAASSWGRSPCRRPSCGGRSTSGVPVRGRARCHHARRLDFRSPHLEWASGATPSRAADDYDLIVGYSPYDNIEAMASYSADVRQRSGSTTPESPTGNPPSGPPRMRRATKTDSNLLVMRMNMGAGHFANSGRYGRLRDTRRGVRLHAPRPRHRTSSSGRTASGPIEAIDRTSDHLVGVGRVRIGMPASAMWALASRTVCSPKWKMLAASTASAPTFGHAGDQVVEGRRHRRWR